MAEIVSSVAGGLQGSLTGMLNKGSEWLDRIMPPERRNELMAKVSKFATEKPAMAVNLSSLHQLRLDTDNQIILVLHPVPPRPFRRAHGPLHHHDHHSRRLLHHRRSHPCTPRRSPIFRRLHRFCIDHPIAYPFHHDGCGFIHLAMGYGRILPVEMVQQERDPGNP